MLSGERALQGATLFFIENRCWVIQHSRALSDLMELMGELAELRAMVETRGYNLILNRSSDEVGEVEEEFEEGFGYPFGGGSLGSPFMDLPGLVLGLGSLQ